MDPETAVSPMIQAPPDRPTTTLEQALQQVMALIFGDRVLDMRERELLHDFFSEVALRAQAGGIGNGGTPSANPSMEAPPQSPMEMNQNTQDMGTVEGAVPEEEGVYGV